MFKVYLEVPRRYLPEELPEHQAKVIGSSKLLQFLSPMSEEQVEHLVEKVRKDLSIEEFGLLGQGKWTLGRGHRPIDLDYVRWATKH